MSTATDSFYERRFNTGGLDEERVRRCLRIFQRFPCKTVLDVGCADGEITAAIQTVTRAREAYGVEIAAPAVAMARERGIKAVQIDVNHADLPFDREFFDGVYCGEIIEHLFDPGHLLREIRRVLKPGGICVLTTPNLAGWPNRIALFLGYQPFPTAVSPNHEWAGKLLLKSEEGQWGHIRVFTLRALEELVALHNLSILSVEGCPVTINTRHWSAGVITRIDRWLARFPAVANRVILVLRKP
ncbi:MAG: class I SAM-dependent methyltransferase [Armatimonadota bacterium]|nr:class I SAM-dependent methyltransferase [Armatimonadota bacterium]MDR7559067.1 class I SAM-dependent methyltransferase [Armatimonadota bacterium]